MSACPSPSAVKKVGSTLRKWLRGEIDFETNGDKINRALDVLIAYRAAHAPALASANMGLRSMVTTAGCDVEVTQRLKRIPTILNKLQREPTLPLSSMQDIGGVRAVLNSIDEIRRVEARVRKNRPVIDSKDYVREPRVSGYRGVHLVVEYRERHIEIQLRTRVMHEWAITVERVSGRLGTNLKQDGEHAIQNLMRAISGAMATEELGGTVDEDQLSELAGLRELAAPYLRQTWGG